MSTTGEKPVKKNIKKVTVLNKELFETTGMQEKLAAALEKMKKEKPEPSMSKDGPAPSKPTSTEIKQLLKRKVEERKLAATPPPQNTPPGTKKDEQKLNRRRPEPAKVPRKSAATRQKIQEQVIQPASFNYVEAPVPAPIVKQEQHIQKQQLAVPVSVPSSSTSEINEPSPSNQFYEYSSYVAQPQPPPIHASAQEIHPISISYTENEPVLKNIPNTMILPMVMEQTYDPIPETFDEGTRESMYSNEVNEEGEDGVNFLNSMFAGISNQNSNDYSSSDEEEDGQEAQDYDYDMGEDYGYENSRGVEYTIREIDETKPARPIILEEKILADNEKFSADWVDKIVKTEVKTEPSDYNFYQPHDQYGTSSSHHEASSSPKLLLRKESAAPKKSAPQIKEPVHTVTEPVIQAPFSSEEISMEQDPAHSFTSPTEEIQVEEAAVKDQKPVPPRNRRPKPKVNLVQRNKPNLPQSRKPKVNQSKNLSTQISEEPPPTESSQAKKTATTTIATTPTPQLSETIPKSDNQSFFENSEISPHRKKVDTIDLTDPDEIPLSQLSKQKSSDKKKTPKRKAQTGNQTSIKNFFTPPNSKSKKAKNEYDSEEELPGFDNNTDQSYNYLIIEDEIPESIDMSLDTSNLRRTEPTPPPLGNISCKKKVDTTKKTNVKKKSAPQATKLGLQTLAKNNKPSPVKQKLTKTIHPYLLLVKHRKTLDDHPEEFQPVEVVDCKPGTVQCGFCGEISYSNEWLSHLETHYGVGWKVGEPDENVSLYSHVLQKIISFLKTNKLESMACRMCSKKYKSGLGLLSHVEMCGLNKLQRNIECEFCKRYINKVYMNSHLRSCNVLFEMHLKELLEKTNAQKVGKDAVVGKSGRVKRASMVKAEGMMKSFQDEFDPDVFIKFPTLPKKGIHNKWKKELRTKNVAKCYFKNCTYSSTNVADLKFHVTSCEAITSLQLKCLKCEFSHEVIDVLRQHIRASHRNDTPPEYDSDAHISTEESSDDEFSGVDDNENDLIEEEELVEDKKNKSLKKKTPQKEKANTSVSSQKQSTPKSSENKYRKLVDLARSSIITGVIDKYTSEFIKKHYSQTALYRNFAPHYFISSSKIESYFPLNEHSMLFADIPISQNFNKYLGDSASPAQQWLQLDRFRGTSLSTGEKLMFIGGPISAIAWAPISDQTDSQYIAVAYRKDFNDFTLQKKPAPKRTMILIIEQTASLEHHPHILYGFKIENGPVNHLEFMPSGGYSKSMNRLGLLAVSSIETDVHVYSLPITCKIKMEKVEDNFCDNDIDFKFLEIRPSFTLVVDARKNFDLSHEKNNMSVFVKWSKGKNHNIIAAGFANGAFAIWDIDEDPENLSRIYTNSSLKYVPSCYIAHIRNQIVGLDFHYDEHGPKWLAVCGITRIFNVYDIEDLSLPKLINSDVSFNIMSSMEWPYIWELFCYSSSDWFATYGNCVTFSSPMALFARHVHKSRTLCGINDTAFNPWFNSYLSGADNGDIVVDFVKELNCPLDSRSFCKDTMLIACTDLARLDSQPIPKKKTNIMNNDDWKWFEDDYKNKYGLLFGGLKSYHYVKHKYLKSMDRQPSPNLCRYLRINKVKSNTNPSANTLMAVGYENGFLKIFSMEKDSIYSTAGD